MRLKFDAKNFFLGFGAMFLCLIIPVISDVFISIVTKVRDALPFSKKK